ncbi:MAG: hypothetical protein ABL998_17295, partial [Planctomycetota bacterium]
MKPRASLFVLARRAALVLGLVLLGLFAAEVLRFARVAAGFSAMVGAAQAFGTGDELATLREERLRMPFGFERWVELALEPTTKT